MGRLGGSLLTGAIPDSEIVENLLSEYIDPITMKALFQLCLRVDISDNNDKAEIARELLGGKFAEVGTGTNRIAFRYNGFVIKIALDRRGLVDNHQEFKRSIELPEFLAKTYETNYLINICEYVEVMDQDQFVQNEEGIKILLGELSKNYLFQDVGYTLKNSYNWGSRDFYDEEAGRMDKSICILDYGYLYPLHDQKDSLMRCPKCSHQLQWNTNFTMLLCRNSTCGFQITPMDLRRKMNLGYEDLENKICSNLSNLKMPDLRNIEKAQSVISK